MRSPERSYVSESIDLSLPILADLVGTCWAVIRQLIDLVEAHVLDTDRLYADDTQIRVLAEKNCKKVTACAYVRNDRHTGTSDPRTVRDQLSLRYSRTRKGEHLRYLSDFAGVLQADAFPASIRCPIPHAGKDQSR